MQSKNYILTLETQGVGLDIIGGKAANLVKLVLAGYRVPRGYIITTLAYRAFTAQHNLEARVLEKLSSIASDNPNALQEVSQAIRSWFSEYEMNSDIAQAIRQAYLDMGRPPVAVRSSATTEDLPELSFAGLQDTFLNVIGEESLLAAVINCWSSLWTARAIGYRSYNKISHHNLSLAVVIQEMVASEVSGVLFTANPLTGKRNETVIDATLGLGEALVSGQVEPDHYVVDPIHRKIMSKNLGSKQNIIRAKTDNGGVEKLISVNLQQALPDERILELTAMCQCMALRQLTPQDTEWAYANGQLYLLQTRPITSLFPLPRDIDSDSLRLMFSFGAVQGLLDPMTPLGQDTIRLAFASGASMFGYQLTSGTQTSIRVAGERLWGDASGVMRNKVGRRFFRNFLKVIEPGIGQIIESLWYEPQLQPGKKVMSLDAARHTLVFMLPMLARFIKNWRDPDGQRERIAHQAEKELVAYQKKFSISGEMTTKLYQRVALFFASFRPFPSIIPDLISVFASGLILLVILNRLVSKLVRTRGDGNNLIEDTVMEITRGLPYNVTIEMDLALWKVAQTIRADSGANAYFVKTSINQLANDYLAGKLPRKAQQGLDRFIAQYGMRGTGELDLGRPRWREDPAPLFQALVCSLSIEDENQAPDAVFKRSVKKSEEAIATIGAVVRQLPGGWMREKVFRFAARRIRALAGTRENPKFYIIRRMGLIRQALLESGRELVAAGLFSQPDDIFYLYAVELEALAKGEQRDWAALIQTRRTTYQREMLRKRLPRVLLSDGRAFYDGFSAFVEENENNLIGNPVSAGVVEGMVRVVLDPRCAQLQSGEILVCPGTDPAWTPLFLSAAGLIMEVGGMMTHGAVVAREYGIPAVVGVQAATTRLKTGQKVHLNGSTGEVSLI